MRNWRKQTTLPPLGEAKGRCDSGDSALCFSADQE